MIVTRLAGGLGNQLFQYAAGRRLAHARGTQLALDTQGFQSYTLRRYALGPFQTIENFASPEEVAAWQPAPRSIGTNTGLPGMTLLYHHEATTVGSAAQ
jgi:hypothetical protein